MPLKAKSTFNITIFRRDVYQLAAMLVAKRKIDGEDELKDLAKEHFGDQVSRLLVLLAVSARQLMEQIDLPVGWKKCGRHQREGEEEGPMKFQLACSAIIHATVIGPYIRDKKSSMTNIKISSTAKQVNLATGETEMIKTKSKLNSRDFLRCCTILSRDFIGATGG